MREDSAWIARRAAGFISLVITLAVTAPLALALHSTRVGVSNGGAPPAQPAVLRTVRVGSNPVAVVVDARTQRVFVVNLGRLGSVPAASDASVSVLDAATGALIHTVPLGVALAPGQCLPPQQCMEPQMAAVDERTGRVFIATPPLTAATSTSFHPGSVSVVVLDAATGAVRRVIHHVGRSAEAHAVDVDAPAGWVFVSTGAVLDATSGAIRRWLPLGGAPLAVDEATQRVAVANMSGRCRFPSPYHDSSSCVSVLDAVRGTILSNVVVPGSADDMAVDERVGRFIVAMGGTRATNTATSVSVLDATSGALWRHIDIPSPGLSSVVAVDTHTGRAFVVNLPDGYAIQQGAGAVTVSVIDTHTGHLLRAIPLGEGDTDAAITVDERTTRAFVATNNGALGVYQTRLCALNGRDGRVGRCVRLGRGLPAMAADESTGQLFVANRSDGTVSVLDTAHL